jgi:hypothetical protein
VGVEARHTDAGFVAVALAEQQRARGAQRRRGGAVCSHGPLPSQKGGPGRGPVGERVEGVDEGVGDAVEEREGLAGGEPAFFFEIGEVEMSFERRVERRKKRDKKRRRTKTSLSPSLTSPSTPPLGS